MTVEISNGQELALRCHDISTGLGPKEVPEFELIPEIGLMLRLALHIRGLPRIPYETLKLVASYYLQMSSLVLKGIVESLAKVEFVKIMKEGDTIKWILPTVPYYEDLYEQVGEYATSRKLNEPEQLAITILGKLTDSPILQDNLNSLGADQSLLKRSLKVGTEGNYILKKRFRGKDVLLSPVFFSENAEIYADLVAKTGAKTIEKILRLIKQSQGIPLSVVEATGEIYGTKISNDELNLLKRLASDGAVKPPSIQTPHAGTNYFMFTPSPGKTRLNPTKRDIYERAMALVSAVRQGQFLPNKYAIKSPYAILNALQSRGFIKANTEAYEQYKNLTVMKVGHLASTGGNWYQFQLNDTEENQEALEIALELVTTGNIKGLEIDENARLALGKDQTYIESLISSQNLREKEQMPLSEEQQEEVENFFLGGVKDN